MYNDIVKLFQMNGCQLLLSQKEFSRVRYKNLTVFNWLCPIGHSNATTVLAFKKNSKCRYCIKK